MQTAPSRAAHPYDRGCHANDRGSCFPPCQVMAPAATIGSAFQACALSVSVFTGCQVETAGSGTQQQEGLEHITPSAS